MVRVGEKKGGKRSIFVTTSIKLYDVAGYGGSHLQS
jgi:hypothetical protein